MDLRVSNPNNLPLIDYRTLKPLQGNLKDLNETNYNKLKNVLETRGFKVPLFVWKNGDNLMLMDGHQRQRVLTKENAQPYELPYLLIEADNEIEAKAQLLEITSQYGTTTQEGYDEFIAEIPEAEVLNVHIDALPFENQDPEPEIEEDEAPEVSSEPAISKLGEVYQLGRHRLMCGSATEASDVVVLMNGEKADMVFTDPPYGVNYQSNMRTKTDKFDVLENDDVIDASFVDIAKSQSTGWILVCTSWKVLKQWLDIIDMKLGNMIIWDKGGGGIGDLEHSLSTDYEVILAYNPNKTKIAGKRIGSVWSIGKDGASSYKHPTQKPVELPAQAIKSFSTGSILDLFGGSGSTLIACEQLDRTCYMMELDPKYCDVIRKRYWKFINEGVEAGWEAGTPKVE